MATIEISDQSLTVHVEGFDQLRAMTRTLTVSLAHVTRVVAAPDLHAIMYMESGTAFRGVHRPGALVVGTLHPAHSTGYVFCDVRDAQRAVSIELRDHECARMVIEVSDETAEHLKRRIDEAVTRAVSV